MNLETKWTTKYMDKLNKKIMKWVKQKDNYDRILQAETEFDYSELVARCAIKLNLKLEDKNETAFIYGELLKIQQDASEKKDKVIK